MATKQLTIPMFPLGIMLLPGETKTLHIFEENFGIPYFLNNKVGDFGIEVKIVKVLKSYESGESDILVEGVRIFNLIEYSSVLKPKLYGAGVISYLDDIVETPTLKLQELIKDYLWIAQQNTVPVDAYDNATLYNIARLLDLSHTEKYELIKLKSVAEKENYLMQKIRLFTFILNAENKLQAKFILN